MIIHLKRFAHALNDNNSVSIPTDLFNDSSLDADAIGLMLYLYSTNKSIMNKKELDYAPLQKTRLCHALSMLAKEGYIELVFVEQS